MKNTTLLAVVFSIPLISVLVFLIMPRPLYYEQRPIHSSVIDGQGQPVQGVIVVGLWLTEAGWFQAHGAGPLEKQIAITDQNGKFNLPGWKKRANEWGLNRRSLQTHQPELIIYKFGYLPKRIHNTSASTGRSILEWRVTGPLEIDELKGDPAQSYRIFSANSGPIHQAMPPLFEGCEWKKFKPLLIEFDKQEQVAEELDLIGRQTGTPLRSWYEIAAENFSVQFPGKKTECPGLVEWLTSERIKRKTWSTE